MKSLLQHWVTDQAMQRPDAVAVSREDTSLSYQDIEVLSNQLGNMLKELGCEQGDHICFLMPKVPEAIMCMMGILKADCIYVPLDIKSPVQRLTKMVNKCRPRCILASGPVDDLLISLMDGVSFDSDLLIGWVDPESTSGKMTNKNPDPDFDYSDLISFSSQPLDYKNEADDPAHILFTSGSNGEPKGVVTSHQNDLEFIRWAKNYFHIQAEDNISNHSPLHFDMSSFDVYGAFSAGAHLHLVPREYNAIPNKIADFIRESNITQWFSVPSVLNYMAQFKVIGYGDLPSLKRLIWGGEVCPMSTLQYWMERLPNVSFTNLYGPTETTIASTYYTVPNLPRNGKEEIPIGEACPGEALYILDEQLNPVPEGEIGELYIAGTGLSQGYWDDPEQTAKSFQFNPYVLNGDRTFYKTGDLAHFDEDGLCYFDGRKDHQIKKTGYRIELSEIEKAVDSLGLTVECAAVAISDGDLENNIICCAYVPAGTKNDHIAGTYLKMKLKNLLPDYMIPGMWKSYVILPKNRNGKIDREVLEKHFLETETRNRPNARVNAE